MHPNLFCWLSHSAQSLHVLKTLHNDCALKEKEHSEVKETVVPILVEQPKESTEKLEHEEGSDKMLLVEL